MEKIDFFLKLEKIHKNVECDLSELVDQYQQLISLNKNNSIKEELMKYNPDIKDNNEYINSIFENKNVYKNQLMKVKRFHQFVKQALFDVCDHHYVKDNIDITCEISQEIHYCEICSCNYEDYLKNKKSK